MAEQKIYVKVEFHLKVPARDLDEAMEKARTALHSGNVTFDSDSTNPEKIIAYDGQMSDDSGYVNEPIEA